MVVVRVEAAWSHAEVTVAGSDLPWVVAYSVVAVAGPGVVAAGPVAEVVASVVLVAAQAEVVAPAVAGKFRAESDSDSGIQCDSAKVRSAKVRAVSESVSGSF